MSEVRRKTEEEQIQEDIARGVPMVIIHYDKDGNHCTRENMAYMNIVIYTKDGQYVNSVYGKNPYH